MKQKRQNSNIPFAQRLQMQKQATIAAHRDEAARVALQIACVALNDTEGLGYTRLTRFAKRLAVLIAEYYEDTEMGAVHLKQRMEQLGFIVRDGRIFAAENDETGEIVPTKMLVKEEQNDG